MSDLFPRSGDVSRAQFWTGLRPMTPDGTPLFGPTRYANLGTADLLLGDYTYTRFRAAR